MNKMVCGDGMVWGGWARKGDGREMRNWGGVNLVLGDCVWCVLLPKPVANATNSSKTTPPISHN